MSRELDTCKLSEESVPEKDMERIFFSVCLGLGQFQKLPASSYVSCPIRPIRLFHQAVQLYPFNNG